MNVVGIMWARNEADIIAQTIEAALKKVDSLMVIDDDSTDQTWEIIKSFGKRIEHRARRCEAGTLTVHPRLWGRQHLLNQVRKRYKPEDTWVQVIESDMMILDTDVREAVAKFACSDVGVFWQMLNAYRKPLDWGPEVDKWPHWDRPIQEVMPYGHVVETMLYTFRPVPEIDYTEEWRPWPRGFGAFDLKEEFGKCEESPLLAHYGYRGPTHYYSKVAPTGQRQHPKYTTWNFESPATVLATVSMFNGQWNRKLHDMSREGWKTWVNRNRVSPTSTLSQT